MESFIIWGFAIILIMTIFVPYLIKFRKTQKINAERKAEAARLGADRPIAQFPQIDEMRCIGCAACVDACPEGNVLGIVNGKATVINGLKCVGHGRCAEACPVEGIKVGLGDIRKRDDIPLMNEHNETNIPGVYIAGELGGFALIRNAIAQGKTVVDKIAENHSSSSTGDEVDILIVGAGPAGTTAALTAMQHNLSHLIIDQQGFGGTILQYPRKKLVMTRPVEIPLYGMLSKPEYSKEELLDIWEDIYKNRDLRIKTGEKLENVEKQNGHYLVKTHKAQYVTKKIILALGRRGTPRKLGVPGEDMPKVMYKLLDAESYRDNHVLVVGGGDSAVEAAIGLSRQRGNKVTLSYRKEKFFRIKKKNELRLQEMASSESLDVVYNSQVNRIENDSIFLKFAGKEQQIPNDYVFIFAGGEPPFKLLKKIGIAFGGESNEVA